MAGIKNALYKNIPFSNETPQGEFYSFVSAIDLGKKCKEWSQDIVKCQTVGILSSDCGIFYLESLNQSSKESPIQVSMIYLVDPPPSSVLRNPVQVFGELMWKGRPVLYIRIIKLLSAHLAITLNASLEEVAVLHTAHPPQGTRIEDT